MTFPEAGNLALASTISARGMCAETASGVFVSFPGAVLGHLPMNYDAREEVAMKIVGKGDPKKERGYRYVMWDAVAEALAKNPDVPILLDEFKDTPKARSVQRTVNSKDKKPKALRDLGGSVRAFTRNNTIIGDLRYADVYIIWSPNG